MWNNSSHLKLELKIARPQINKRRNLHVSFQTTRSCAKHLRSKEKSLVDDVRAEVTSQAERHLQLICLFALVSINVGASVRMAARGLLVFITGGEMI